ncbi:hypothetical protein CVIRNUC_002858 [Coccomyxa viridis]|uniref:Plastid lipid-associated protein/fibrillin conserved domain-containing protein n=1 Tax=Coccomyxa viridis TaxID=1274662 RepID=A0AAV1HWV0_9CHLO|nr:hypothetical protein CVIRNUC_002858 [Coccomyxa viridis]
MVIAPFHARGIAPMGRPPFKSNALMTSSTRAREALRLSAVQAQQVSVKGHIKGELLSAIASIPHTGVYGIEAGQKEAVLSLIEQVEATNPLKAPTQHLEQCQGSWRLLFSTVTILGRRRIKLGLKEVVNVGELTQHIDIATQHTRNVVDFDILLFGKFRGSLTIEAKYKPVSPCRVSITLEKAMLVPQQFQKLFEKNYDLLLSIFNPEGWLDITYVDAEHRIGRDDKGNIFVLERI